MQLFELWEGKNCQRSHVYDKYIRFTCPFHIAKWHLRDRRRRVKIEIESKHNQIGEHKLIKSKSQVHIVELTIADNSLLQEILLNKEGEFLLDRYLIEWTSKKYFLYRYKASVYFIDNNIVVFKILLQYDRVDEVQLNRELLINNLLTLYL